jgi:hypothetical protein
MFWSLVIVLFVWLASGPAWPNSRRRGWGYAPFGAQSALTPVFVTPWLIGPIAVTV